MSRAAVAGPSAALRAALAAAGLCAALEPSARAADRPVALAIVSCPSLPDRELRAAMHVELGDRLLAPTASTASTDRVIVTCDGDRATVLAEGAERPPLARSLSLGSYPPDARPRLVTLVAVELLAAGSRRITDDGQLVAETSARSEGPRLLLGPAMTMFLARQGLVAPGGTVRFERSWLSTAELVFDLSAGGERRTIAAGAVSAFVASASGAFSLRRALGGDLVLGGGGGVRLGLVHLGGDPADATATGHAVTRAWGGPLLAVSLELCRNRLCGELGLEAGAAVLGARGFAGDSRAIAASGAWLGGGLAGGWRF